MNVNKRKIMAWIILISAWFFLVSPLLGSKGTYVESMVAGLIFTALLLVLGSIVVAIIWALVEVFDR